VADIQTYPGMSLLCDSQRITQVISNLVRNSIDFVPEKTGLITIRSSIYNTENSEAKLVQGSNKMVLFAIQDNGIGIPPSKIDSLFKKFYQVDTMLTRKHQGTGLGLAICKGIIEAHGGKIWFEKGYTKGTLVKFTLPGKMNDTKENRGKKTEEE
jgi:signal transduction histidine kinase